MNLAQKSPPRLPSDHRRRPLRYRLFGLILAAILAVTGLGLTQVATAPPASAAYIGSCQTFGPKVAGPQGVSVPIGLLCSQINYTDLGYHAGSRINAVDLSFGRNEPSACGYWVDFDLLKADHGDALAMHDQGVQLPCKNTFGTSYSVHKELGWYASSYLNGTYKGCTRLFRNNQGKISLVAQTCRTFYF